MPNHAGPVQQATPDSRHKAPATHDPALSDEALVQRAFEHQESQAVYSPALVRALSRVVGNQAAQRMVQRAFGPISQAPTGPRIQRDTASNIANGHSWDKHKVDEGLFPDISTKAEFADLIRDVMANPEGSKDLARGRKAYYKGKVVVIVDPGSADKGTCFTNHNPAAKISRLT